MSRPRTSLPSGCGRRPCRRRSAAPPQGAASNDKKSADPRRAKPGTGRTAKELAKELVKDREALGRSRGGLSSKVHLAVDSNCRPLSRVTSAGQRGDSLGFTPVLKGIRIHRNGPGRPRTRPGRVLADKAYSSKANRAYLREHNISAVIPQRADEIRNRKNRGRRGGRDPVFDAEAYKDRNTVERGINRLKQFRAFSTRYDKRDYVWRGTVDVASIRIWLRNPTS